MLGEVRVLFCLKAEHLVQGAALKFRPRCKDADSGLFKNLFQLLCHCSEVGAAAAQQLRSAGVAHFIGYAAEIEVVGLLAFARGVSRGSPAATAPVMRPSRSGPPEAKPRRNCGAPA